LDDVWFTLSRNTNSHSNRCWCYENPPLVGGFPWHGRKVQWVHTQSQALCFFEETDSNCYIKLIPTPVFRELTGKEWSAGQLTFLASRKRQYFQRSCQYFKKKYLSCI
jgi:hypothetical protein